MKKLIIILLITLYSDIILSQEILTEGGTTLPLSVGQPVRILGEEIFRIYTDLPPLSIEQRSEAISQRLKTIFDDKTFNPNNLKILTTEKGLELLYNEEFILSITDSDSLASNKNPEQLGNYYIEQIRNFFDKQSNQKSKYNPVELVDFINSNKDLFLKFLLGFGAACGLILVYYILTKVFRKLLLIAARKDLLNKSFSFRGMEVFNGSSFSAFLILIIKAIKFTLFISLFYLFINAILNIFPLKNATFVKDTIRSVLSSIITIVIAWGIYKIIKLSINRLQDNLSSWKGTIIKPLKFKTIQFLSEDQSVNFLHKSLNIIHLFLNLTLLYLLITLEFSYFDFTRNWAEILFGYILNPVKMMITSFIDFLPNLFFILVISVINFYIIKIIKLIFKEIEYGNITIPNFQIEWAELTFKIARTLVFIFSLIIIFPYLPGSQSEAFKGVSIFVGVLFSLGSSSFISNIIAGLNLTYMQAFRIGDRVKIGDTMGDILEKTMLVTRVKTIKNIIISIPNSIVMGSHIINYTTSSKLGEGLILTTTVTLGYDIPWRDVHKVLLDAASSTQNVSQSSKAFVLQTSLDDFYVCYELNCYTDRPEIMARTYSELHQNIQDKCNEAGIEILSPHYKATRDGNESTIPKNYRPADYEAPSFRISNVDK